MNLPSGWSWRQNGATCVAYSIDGSSLPGKLIIGFERNTGVEHLKLAGWGSKSIQAQKVPIPDSFELRVGPNPFNPGCTISFTLSNEVNIDLDVYNIKGQYMASIAGGKLKQGNHQLYWSPSNFSSGAYFIHISDGNTSQFEKVLYLK